MAFCVMALWRLALWRYGVLRYGVMASCVMALWRLALWRYCVLRYGVLYIPLSIPIYSCIINISTFPFLSTSTLTVIPDFNLFSRAI